MVPSVDFLNQEIFLCFRAFELSWLYLYSEIDNKLRGRCMILQ